MPRGEWIKKISELQPGHELVLTPWARIKDTIKAIDAVSSHSAATKQASDIATQATSLQDIFDYVLSKVEYKPDTSSTQTVRTLAASLRNGVGNCVDYVTALSAILKAQGKPHKYRLAGYGNNGFEHIYIIADGKILDPVMGAFNRERAYKLKKDIMPNLKVLNGPVEDVSRITDQAPGSSGISIYNSLGGLVRQAYRLSKNLTYNSNQASQIVTKLYDACSYIGGDSRRGNCNKYVNRKYDSVIDRATDSQPSYGGNQGGQGGQGGNFLGFGGNGNGGNTPPPAPPAPGQAGFNITSMLPLLAVAAGTLLLTKKK